MRLKLWEIKTSDPIEECNNSLTFSFSYESTVLLSEARYFFVPQNFTRSPFLSSLSSSSGNTNPEKNIEKSCNELQSLIYISVYQWLWKRYRKTGQRVIWVEYHLSTQQPLFFYNNGRLCNMWVRKKYAYERERHSYI